MPAYNPNNSDMVGWAGETTLDVEYAHVIAPGANLLLVRTPVPETEGVHGFPQIVAAGVQHGGRLASPATRRSRTSPRNVAYPPAISPAVFARQQGYRPIDGS